MGNFYANKFIATSSYSQQLDDGVKIILPSKKNYYRFVWYGLSLFIWIYMTGSITYITSLLVISAIGENSYWIFVGFLVFVLLFLVSMGIALIYSFFWQVAGKEVIILNKGILSVSQHIFGWKRVFEYPLSDVNNLWVNTSKRFQFAPAKIFKNLFSQGGMIEFMLGNKTFSFGLEINEEEARQIASILQKNLSRQKTG